jgi:hypothetical protein
MYTGRFRPFVLPTPWGWQYGDAFENAVSFAGPEAVYGLEGPISLHASMLVLHLPLDFLQAPTVAITDSESALTALVETFGLTAISELETIEQIRVGGRAAAAVEFVDGAGLVTFTHRLACVLLEDRTVFIQGSSTDWSLFAPAFEEMLGSMTFFKPQQDS